MTEIFALQDEMAQAIVSKPRPQLSKGHFSRNQPTQNIEAYHEYLKGNYYLTKQTPESMERARRHFERAILLDPTYAVAYAGLGDYLYFQSAHGLKSPRELMPLAKSAAEKALSIDENLPEAHVVRGIAAVTWEYDWDTAQRHFRLALGNEFISAEVRYRCAFHGLLAFGRIAEAIREMERAAETDPLSAIAKSLLGIHAVRGRNRQARDC